MRIAAAGCLAIAMAFSTMVDAQLPGVAPAQLEQAPKPNPAAPMYRQTGEQYRAYQRNVPMLVPFRRPWTAAAAPLR